MDLTLYLMLQLGAQMFCVTEAMINEASVDGDEGMLAVAFVIKSRVNQNNVLWGDTPCKVVYQPSNDPERPWLCAFSYTCDDKAEVILDHDLWAYYHAAWLVGLIEQGDVLDFTMGADHYLKCGIETDWTRKLEFTVQIGRHCFYRS